MADAGQGRWAALGRRPRLIGAGALGLACGVGSGLLWPQLRLVSRTIIGWDLLVVSFLVMVLQMMWRSTPARIRAHAARDDEGRGLILTLVLAASSASFLAMVGELSLAKAAKGASQAAHVAAAFLTVGLSWLMVQFIFTLHYAHEYYTGHAGEDCEGLLFPGGEEPDYWDFLHFSVVIGVAAQTADVAFTRKGLRRLGTVHSLVAFVFNTVVVALTINLLASVF